MSGGVFVELGLPGPSRRVVSEWEVLGAMGLCTVGLTPPWVMRAGDAASQVTSAAGNAQLIFKADANVDLDGYARLHVYDETGMSRWSSPNSADGYSCAFQADGNLCIYSADGAMLWQSGTAGHPNALLMVQNDGNVVIYDPWPHPLWATGTVH